jgi:hypothetical protein
MKALGPLEPALVQIKSEEDHFKSTLVGLCKTKQIP